MFIIKYFHTPNIVDLLHIVLENKWEMIMCPWDTDDDPVCTDTYAMHIM